MIFSFHIFDFFLLAEGAEKAANTAATKGELLAALGALSAVVVALWRMLVAKTDASEKLYLKKWQDCEEGHEAARLENSQIKQELGEVKGRLAVMHEIVLKRVHSTEAQRAKSQRVAKPTQGPKSE